MKTGAKTNGLPHHHERVRPDRQLELIRRLSPLMSAQSVDQIAAHACSVVADLLDADACSVMLADACRNGLVMRAATHIPPVNWPEAVAAHGTGLMGEVERTARPLLLPRAEDFEDRGLTPGARYGAPTCVLVPILFSNGRVEGVINVASPRHETSFDEEDVEVAQAIAQMISGSLENARALTETSIMRNRLSEILNNLHLGIIALDSSLRITHSNDRFAEWIGRHPSDLNACELRKALDVQIFNVCHRLLREAGKGGGLRQERFEGKLGGRHVKMEITVSSVIHPCSGDGAYLILMEDIGQDEEIRRLREADSIKRSFIRIISHELRTPLTVLQGAIPLLQSCACSNGAGAPTVNVERIQQIQQLLKPNVLRMTNTVNTILDVVEIENGKLELTLAPVDLNKTIEERIRYLADRAASKRIEFDVTLNRDLQMIHADQQRLRQSLYELMDNAIKFSETGQTVRVRTDTIDGMAGVWVSNKGHGIEPNRRGEVFEKFYQLDHELTRKSGGCGLGLYLVRNIAQLHGGSIEIIDGEPDETVFLLRLPFFTQSES